MADMNDSDLLPDLIIERLRNNEPEFRDNRFTAGVMNRLPTRHTLPVWQKNTLLLAATTMGSGLATAQISRPVITDMLIIAAANWTLLFSTAAVITYISAAAAVWIARMS